MSNSNMLRSLCKTYSRCRLPNVINSRRPQILINPGTYQRVIVPSLTFSQQGPSDEQTEEKSPTTQSDDKQSFVLRNKIRQDHIKITPTKKKFLALSGRWKNSKDIPDYLPEHQYNSDMWVVRIRVAAFIMIFWLVTCLCVANVGRKHVKERSHQVVMQQYLDGLSPEEREKFLTEYNLKDK